ncbi:hypothetical protein [uncultured Sphaerotilus sp.]|uniref:hypothetical protein n=1 Tax=uncultured Sphaerotilus sp. TaxID=474984 RepID=UPI0030CA1318
MQNESSLTGAAGHGRSSGPSPDPLPDRSDVPALDLQSPSAAQTLEDTFNPRAWTCSVCGKVRARELLHSKAILGRQQLVCAPSCLGAERRANGR